MVQLFVRGFGGVGCPKKHFHESQTDIDDILELHNDFFYIVMN